ncbi:MAG: hypothetical protein ACYTG2_12325 [Planctomycetota bacterium]|jgi:hypothetical protein
MLSGESVRTFEADPGKDIEARCLSTLGATGYEPRIVEMSGGWSREARGHVHNGWLVCEPPC